jgi:carbamoyl-phosphate synthase small subunit
MNIDQIGCGFFKMTSVKLSEFFTRIEEFLVTKPALLALSDGTLFYGKAIGHIGQTVGEVVFNTAMTGYQEILSDPSYAQQIVTLTYPHIGNVGSNEEDQESSIVWSAGLIIRDLSSATSNWRSQQSLSEYMQQHKIVGIADIDTRHLTHILRDKGAQGACIVSDDIDEAKAIEKAKQFPGLNNVDLAKEVTTKKVYQWRQSVWDLEHGYQDIASDKLKYRVVVYDYGVKHNILRMLAARNCDLTIVPAMTSAEEVIAMNPDGVFLSNGPGDPAACSYAITAVNTLLKHQLPIFGICLGHQILALAAGAKTNKMKFGHHGANHPVQDLQTKQVVISSQNHGFTVDETSLPGNVEITHRSLFDGSIQGICIKDKPIFGFQGHPEASPGPHDLSAYFDNFIKHMKVCKQNIEEQAAMAT